MSIVVALLLGAIGAPAAPAGPAAVPDPPVVAIALVPAGTPDIAAATVDHLADGDVVVVAVRGGPQNTTGSVAQCALTAGGVTECRNHVQVVLDGDGAARFQYQLRDVAGCAAAAPCAVHVRVGDVAGDAVTVFGGPAPPPPTVELRPRGPLRPGSSVVVDVGGVAPGSPVRVAFCAAACSGGTTSAAGADGTVSAVVGVPARCEDCGIAVVAAASRTFVPARFTPPPAPSYDPRRLVVGLGAAAVLLLLAWRIVVGVDWRPPSEAATVDPPP